jgi:hypothetical protein
LPSGLPATGLASESCAASLANRSFELLMQINEHVNESVLINLGRFRIAVDQG